MYLDGKVEQAFQAELASRRQRQIVAAAGVRWKFRANLPLLELPLAAQGAQNRSQCIF